ncbi:hypothetical protein V8F06_011853 [Rhypophila decipiens]
MESKTFTKADVLKHSKPDDLWIILHNKVYDATPYQEDHPGGALILRDVAGRDATTEFEDVGHSLEANDELKHLFLGDLAEDDHAEAVQVYRPEFQVVAQQAAIIVPRKKSQQQQKKSAVRKVLPTALALGLTTGVAVHVKGIDWILKTLGRIRSLPANAILPGSQQLQTASGPGNAFWWGIGIATVAEVSLSVILSLWAWSKFDVQEEFTHLSPHRGARPDLAIPPRVKPSTTTPAKSTITSTASIEPQKWRSFKLVRKILVSPNVYRLVFALPSPSSVLGLPIGQHIALRITDPSTGKPISRSYTPISNNSDLGRVELLVKVYDKGIMTQHLHKMTIGESIEIRGPKGAMQYAPNSYAKRIGMVAGGTGITPMYQVIRAIMEDESDKTKVDLIYANNTVDDILLREELDGFASMCPDRFRVRYVLSHPPGPAADGTATWQGGVGFVTKEMMQAWLPAPAADTKVLLCGPPPMIGAMSRGLVELGFQAPGSVSKAGDQVFLF